MEHEKSPNNPPNVETSERLETWAVVELFGHARIAGKVSERTIAGAAFLRVDVPDPDAPEPAFTRFFGAAAVYSISPCSDEVARLAAKRINTPPVSVYMPEIRALPTVAAEPDQGDDDDEHPY